MTEEQKDLNLGCANLRIQSNLRLACYQTGGEPCSQLIEPPKIWEIVDGGDLCIEINCKMIGKILIQEDTRVMIEILIPEEVKEREKGAMATIKGQLFKIAAMAQADR